MKLVIEMITDNAAFEESGYEEARLLRGVADKIESGYASAAILDINGNRVGHFFYQNEETES